MAVLAYDDVMLREPRLLVPNQQVLGSVKIDWQHPLTRNLSLYLTGHNYIDLVWCKPIAWTNLRIQAVAQRGLAIQGSTSASTGSVPWCANGASPYITVAFWLYIASTPDADDCLLETTANYTTTEGAFFLNARPTGALTKLQLAVHGNGYNITEIDRPAEGAWHHVVMTCDNLAVTESPIGVVDGLPVSATTARQDTSITNNIVASTTCFLLSRNNAALYCGAALQHLAIWNRRLSLNEAIALSRDTLQFLIPA